jgi:hypothetical protein
MTSMTKIPTRIQSIIRSTFRRLDQVEFADLIVSVLATALIALSGQALLEIA